ncbi:PQQ-dependent sugar dehydrogenase [Luteibacter sp. UNCMF366Tsu5.1]|uniref:PQQ-dependent sugar dehydrogenase n=1 Tax=Luteibacter sp. UNCMF366Tsu5.1 TaxID=1502758 RepID=UPI000908C20B|nr:PQQ-dependent sugar dehydrogenase [Luteibacter sp. UNCMF366Tsu5.1]SFW24712.1 Glucose/arabinose dehydrogenase, beta-propeller fold [Luteibacter sp. UNCMF366Tsu5.1]
MKKLANAVLFAACITGAVHAQTNAGDQKPDSDLPFTITKVASLDLPWRIAFLPDGRMLVTEKVGRVALVTPQGDKTDVGGVPASYFEGQNGMLGVFLSPHYAADHSVYLTYVEPGDYGGGVALGRGRLVLDDKQPRLEGFQVLWRQVPTGKGGQPGGQIAFSPDGKYLFLTLGDRQRFTPAQDPSQPLGKILRLTLDGKPAPGNPWAGKVGARTIPLIDPPADTEKAKTAPIVSTYTFTGPNLTPAETWSVGFRTPYGLAFGPDGRLWELEHGPKGGDELNLVQRGKNYGWPLVSYGMNYNGVPIPNPDTRPDLVKPVIYWDPVIAPGNIMFYKGTLFPQWNGSALLSGLTALGIVRVTFDEKGGATAVQRWSVGKRVRDIEEAPDGSLWMLEDASPGGLYHLMPK